MWAWRAFSIFRQKIWSSRKNSSLVRRFFINRHLRNSNLKKTAVLAISRACTAQRNFLTPESDSTGNFLSGLKRKKFLMLTWVFYRKNKKNYLLFFLLFLWEAKTQKYLSEMKISLQEVKNWASALFLVVLLRKNTLELFRRPDL